MAETHSKYRCWKCGVESSNPYLLNSIAGQDGMFCGDCTLKIIEFGEGLSRPRGLYTVRDSQPEINSWILDAAKEIAHKVNYIDLEYVQEKANEPEDDAEVYAKIAAIIAKHAGGK